MVELKDKRYRFGETGYDVAKVLEIPCFLNGRRFSIRTEVVEGDIPWLIGVETLERLDVS